MSNQPNNPKQTLNQNANEFKNEEQQSTPVVSNVSSTVNVAPKLNSTPVVSTLPRPQRFRQFFEYENGTGFYINEDGKRLDYTFDQEGGWFDEFHNYYNKNGDPAIAPNYDDVADSQDDDSGYSDEDRSNYEDNYYHDPLLDEYDMGLSRSHQRNHDDDDDDDFDDDDDDDSYIPPQEIRNMDIAEMTEKIKILHQNQEVAIEYENAPFQFNKDDFYNHFKNVKLNNVQIYKNGKGKIFCKNPEEAIKALKYHKTQIFVHEKLQLELILNVDYLDDIGVPIINQQPSTSHNKKIITPQTTSPSNIPPQNDNISKQLNKQEKQNEQVVVNDTQWGVISEQNNAAAKLVPTPVAPATNVQPNQNSANPQTTIKNTVTTTPAPVATTVIPEPVPAALVEVVEPDIQYTLGTQKQFNLKKNFFDNKEIVIGQLAYGDFIENKHYKILEYQKKNCQVKLEYNKDDEQQIETILKGEFQKEQTKSQQTTATIVESKQTENIVQEEQVDNKNNQQEQEGANANQSSEKQQNKNKQKQ